MKKISLLSGLVAALLAATARADVVGPPPDHCPPGSEPSSSHQGPFCLPKPCTSDADCGSARSPKPFFCRASSLCIDAKSQNVVDTCDPGGTCASPASCVTAN